MEDSFDWNAPLSKASANAERAFQIAISEEYFSHPEAYRNLWATAHIIHCDIIRYVWALECSTRVGLARLLWMGDIVSALYEARKWFNGAGWTGLMSIAGAYEFDAERLKQEIRSLGREHSLRGIDKFEGYRNNVGYHYDPELIGYLREFCGKDVDEFEAILVAYARYSKKWMALCERVLTSKSDLNAKNWSSEDQKVSPCLPPIPFPALILITGAVRVRRCLSLSF